MRVSPRAVGLTTSRLPSSTTKKLRPTAPWSNRISPSATFLRTPNGASRAICPAVSLGNMPSSVEGSAMSFRLRVPYHRTIPRRGLGQHLTDRGALCFLVGGPLSATEPIWTSANSRFELARHRAGRSGESVSAPSALPTLVFESDAASFSRNSASFSAPSRLRVQENLPALHTPPYTPPATLRF